MQPRSKLNLDNNENRESSVILKILEENDFDKIYKWKNDFELVLLNKAHPLPTSKDEISEWFNKNHSDKNQVLFGIYTQKEGFLIGIARLCFIDWISSTAEIGIYIGEKAARGKGYGRNSIKALLNYGFNKLNLHKVHLKVLESNQIAYKLYRNMGFVQEGLLIEHFWANGKYENVALMRMLAKEYHQ